MSAPTHDPDHQDPAQVAPTDSYQPQDPVWVYRDHVWRPGVVEAASAKAATVTYCPTGNTGTGVDTVTARYLTTRADGDPLLDRRRI